MDANLISSGQESGKLALGRRVRDLRKSRDMTLDELGKRIGLSASTLSKIETGSISVNFDTLAALAVALGIELTDLFGAREHEQPAARRVISRAGEGEIYDTSVYRYEMLCTELRNKKFIPILAVIKARDIKQFPKMINHEGEEFIFVVSGTVEIHTVHYAPAILRAGDSIYFDSKMGHAIVTVGPEDAQILWICTNISGFNLAAIDKDTDALSHLVK
jgi:transcriptional regulator with XRE-family HTH domain